MIPSSASCSSVDLGRRAAHGIDSRLVLREGDHVPQVLLAEERHQHPLDPECDAAVGRCAHRERVEEESELDALLVGREPERVEDTGLQLRSWIRNEPPPISMPFTTRSYACARAAPGSATTQLLRAGRGAGERMVHRVQRSSSSSHSNMREVGHPERIATHPRPRARARDRGGGAAAPSTLATTAGIVGAEEDRRARARPGSARARGSERNLAIGERTSPASSKTRYARPFAPHSFATSSSRRELAAGERLRNREVAHARRVREDAELGAARESVASSISRPKRRSGLSLP